MDAKNLLIDSLDKQRAAYRENLKLCRAEFSRKPVHDLRTSICRLLATLDVIAFVTSASRIEKLSNRLKEQLDNFSALRDIQVMLDRVSEDIRTFPELEPFQNYLEKREKRKQRSDEKHIQNIKLGGVEKRLLKIQGAVEDFSAGELQDKLPQAVDEAYLTVMQRYAEIDPAQLVSIHHLRVAFKKFRYMVETIYPCLPDSCSTCMIIRLRWVTFTTYKFFWKLWRSLPKTAIHTTRDLFAVSMKRLLPKPYLPI